MDDLAHRPVCLLAELPLDADILASGGPQTLDDGGVGVELGLFEAGHEAVASRPHALRFGALQGEVELALVRLSDACWEI